MIISERTKCTCYLKCDKCGKKWQGNYYIMKKRDVHLCPSCAFKKGWKEKFIKEPFLIPTELKPYIIKRLDGISLDEHFPKKKSLKIIIKCSNCGYKRQSNSYDVINKNSTLCNSCKQKGRWFGSEGKKLKDKRGTEEYRKMMSESMRNSQAWKDTQHLRIAGLKKYWKRKRGGKELYEILSVWNLYRKTVYKFTEKIYRKFRQNINPDNLPRGRGKYHVDHKFSILEGFKNNIPPYVIAHQSNLQMLSEYENIVKDCKCDINMKELFGGVFGSLVAK